MYYTSLGAALPNEDFLDQFEKQADRMNIRGMTILFGIVSVTLVILFVILHLMKENEKKHKMQLEKISDIANKDPLTGVNNHRAYIENEKRLLLAANYDPNYAYGLVVCDVNDLKYINDKFGHDYGDDYVCKASQLICGVYQKSMVFRIGGDEFVVIIEGEDYADREALLTQLKEESMKNVETETDIVIAAGMAIKQRNESFQDVFHRADKDMYRHKNQLKEKRPSHNLR